jgi:hypothetical protein
MASWEGLAAMLHPPSNPLSKMSRAGLEARKTRWSKVDNKSVIEKERKKRILQK